MTNTTPTSAEWHEKTVGPVLFKFGMAVRAVCGKKTGDKLIDLLDPLEQELIQAIEQHIKQVEVEASKQVYKLWKLLDDIDTAADAYKGNYQGFQTYVSKRLKERFDIVLDQQLNGLYERFYKPELTSSHQESKGDGNG